MPSATRLGDYSSGHDVCAPKALISGSNNVLINGLPAGRVGDKYASHFCDAHPPHNDSIQMGSSTVSINGLSAGRLGDKVIIGGSVAGGSPNVMIG